MLAFLYLSFCAFSAATDVNTSGFHLGYPTTDKDVSYCVRNIIREIVEHNHFIVDMNLMNINDVLEISTLHGIMRVRCITRTFSWIESKLSHRIYVMSCKNFEEFESGMKKAMDDFYFYSMANFIIVMEDFKDYHHSKMIKFLAFNNIYNVTILARDDFGYGIYAFHSPIHPCNQQERLVVVSHCAIFQRGSLIFPKIEAIRGCSFRLLAHNFFPLINFDNRDEDGIEQRLIKYFEKFAHVEIEIIPFSKIDKFGRLVGNFTYTDILNKVQNNEFEGAMGGYFVTKEGMGKFTFSYPLNIDHMVVIMPRSYFLDTWQALFQKAFLAVVFVFFLFIIFSVSAYALSLFPLQRADPVRDMLIVFGYFLNKITMHKFKSGIPETLIICSLLFSVFIIPYTMQAYMCSIMTHPIRGYEPKEFEEVLQCCKLTVSSEWMKEGLARDRLECQSRIDCLKVIKNQKDKSKYTFIANDLYEAYKWMLADEQCNLPLYKIKEPVATLMRTTYFRRGSVLMQAYNKFFFRVMSGGLLDNHYKQIKHTERLKCKPQHVTAFAPLKMKDLKMSFTLLIGGLGISAVRFAYEVLTPVR